MTNDVKPGAPGSAAALVQQLKQEVQEEPKTRDIITISELMEMHFEDAGWLVDGLIPAEGIIGLSGAPATYKTWLAWEIAFKVASGELLFGQFQTEQGGVLIIDQENSPRLLQQRANQMRDTFDLPIYLMSLKSFKITKQAVEGVIASMEDRKIKLVILDSLVRLHAVDENDAMGMASVFSLLKEFNRVGISVLFLHHNRKPGPQRSSQAHEMRGSSDILAAVDCHLAVERKNESLLITQTKSRQAEEMKPFQVNVLSDDVHLSFEFAGEAKETKAKRGQVPEAVTSLLTEHAERLSKDDILQRIKVTGLDVGISTLKSVLDEMVKTGLLNSFNGEKNKKLYALKASGGQTAGIEA